MILREALNLVVRGGAPGKCWSQQQVGEQLSRGNAGLYQQSILQLPMNQPVSQCGPRCPAPGTTQNRVAEVPSRLRPSPERRDQLLHVLCQGQRGEMGAGSGFQWGRGRLLLVWTSWVLRVEATCELGYWSAGGVTAFAVDEQRSVSGPWMEELEECCPPVFVCLSVGVRKPVGPFIV